MTYSKSDKFEIELQELAEIGKLCAHPARLAILQHLSKSKKCISGNISKELPLSRTTVSQHLKELKKSGLIIGEIEGKNICYCINSKRLVQVKKAINNFWSELSSSFKNCC